MNGKMHIQACPVGAGLCIGSCDCPTHEVLTVRIPVYPELLVDPRAGKARVMGEAAMRAGVAWDKQMEMSSEPAE